MRTRTTAAVLALALLGLGADNPLGLGGNLPICDAGPPQVVECTGPFTNVQLSGLGSINPDGGGLRYRWEICGDPRVTIDNELIATPILTYDLRGVQQVTCDAFLIVKNKSGMTNCMTTVTVRDTTPPILTCPPDWAVPTDGSTDPLVTGMATAVDLCQPQTTVTYADLVLTDRIVRRWFASDGFNITRCDQNLLFVSSGFVHTDVIPGVCPNGLNVGGSAPLGQTLDGGILGNAIDVTNVDLTSISMSRLDVFNGGPLGPGVAPLSATLGDVGSPFIGPNLCDCAPLGLDGTLDVDLVFDEQQVIIVLGLANEPDGTVVPLLVRGLFLDGSPFEGVDCVLIQNP